MSLQYLRGMQDLEEEEETLSLEHSNVRRLNGVAFNKTLPTFNRIVLVHHYVGLNGPVSTQQVSDHFTSITRKTVYRYLRLLEEKGLLESVHHMGHGGNYLVWRHPE